MRIFNEVGRWYSIPCKILTQVIYVKKNLNPLKRISYHPDTDPRTDGLTDRQTDGQTDGRTGWIQYTPLNFVAGGIITFCQVSWPLYQAISKYLQTSCQLQIQLMSNFIGALFRWLPGLINSLWPDDNIWCYSPSSVLVHLMDCCCTISINYLNQFWFNIIGTHFCFDVKN